MMKYQVGDLVFIKHYKHKPRVPFRINARYSFGQLLRHELFNSYGIVTQAIKHSDAWEGQSTNRDNVYIWFSQIDGKQYFFCENEVTGEVVE